MNFKNFGNEPLANGGATCASGTAKPSDVFSLARQSSVYSLSFDEFQRCGSIGKDFGSMNMEEFLKNIWTVEESQQIVGSTSGFDGSGTPGNCLQRQESITLPQTLSQKTVEEVWNDLSNEETNLVPRQLTLGEVTLEEFLLKAGVENLPEKGRNCEILGDLNCPISNQSIGFGFQQMGYVLESNNQPGLMGNCVFEGNNQSILQTNNLPLPVNGARDQQLQQIFPKQPPLPYANAIHVSNGTHIGGPGIGIMGANGVDISTSSPNLNTQSFSPVPYVFTGGLRGRRGNNVVEKVIERRHRRMIKNRESAARSRARKQAYTMELEVEIANLKEEYQALEKKQARIMEMQKNKIVETKNVQQGGKKQCLKRTQTGPW